MAQTTLSIRMDEELKRDFSTLCDELGMNMTTAFTVFAKKAVREQKIPFELSADPFYSDENMAYLEMIVNDVKSGKAKLAEHELIEVCKDCFNIMSM